MSINYTKVINLMLIFLYLLIVFLLKVELRQDTFASACVFTIAIR